ncbi:MAG: ABC transporter permease [Chloroflexota bacterium]
MLKQIWFVAAKDLRQLIRDRGALIMLFVVPLLLMGILGAAFSSFGNGSATRTTLPVVNRDGSAMSVALISALRRAPTLNVQVRSDVPSLKKAVRDGTNDGLLIIPAGFGAALHGRHPNARVNFYTVSNNNSTSAQLLSYTVGSVIQRFAFQRVTASAVTQAQQQAAGKANPAVTRRLAVAATQSLDRTPPVSLRTVNVGQNRNAQDNTVPGYALMFALFGVTAGAGSILEEKEAGTFKRLLIAPLAPFALLGGKLLATFLQIFVQLIVLFALGSVLFKINLGPSLPALLLLIVGTSFAATGLGMILVSLVKNQRQLRPISTVIVLSFSAIGGSWWPVSIEPSWMQNLGKVTLNGWAMRGFNGLMIFDKSFSQVLPYIGALFLYGVICFAIARRAFQLRTA